MIEEYKNNLIHKSNSNKVVTNKSSTTKVEKNKVVFQKMTIHIYGQVTKPAVESLVQVAPVIKSRAPASVLEEDVPNDTKETIEISPYSKDYKNQYRESDKLINDLKKL